MSDLTAGEIMTREVVTVAPHATLRQVAETLADRGISGAPVVDDDGRLLGIITEADLIDSKKRENALPRSALFGFFPMPEETLRRALDDGMALQAQALMTRDVVTAAEDATLDELGRLMRRRRINRVPIVRDGRLVGIVTRQDILSGLLGER